MFSSVSVWLLIFVAIMAALTPDVAVAALGNFLERRRIMLKYEKIKKEKRNENTYAANFDANITSSNSNNIEMTRNVSPVASGSRRRYSINRMQDRENAVDHNNNNNINLGSSSHAPGQLHTSHYQQQSYVNKSFAFDDLNRVDSVNDNMSHLQYEKTESYVSVRF
jgi:hypothetical protein